MNEKRAILAYQNYCATEWIFWLNLKGSRTGGDVSRNYNVGKFIDPDLKGEFYIKDGNRMLTRTKAGEDPLKKVIEEAEKVASIGGYRFINEVRRTWPDILKDKGAPPKPFREKTT